MDPISLEQQLTLEELFDKNQLMPRLRSEFINDTELNVAGFAEEAKLPFDFVIDLLAQMALRKRADLPTLVGLLRHHFNGEPQTTADNLFTAANENFVDWEDSIKCFVLVVDVTQEVHRELESFQYPMPLVIPPRKLKTNTDSAYITGKGSLLLRDNHHNDDICLDHLNRMNRIKLSVNKVVANTVRNSWKNIHKQKPEESLSEFKKRQRAFAKYDRSVDSVFEILDDAGNEFHLGHRVDKRGRTYCQGYHVNYQGNDWNKAVVEFAERETLR